MWIGKRKAIAQSRTMAFHHFTAFDYPKNPLKFDGLVE